MHRDDVLVCNHRVGEADGGRVIYITDPACIGEFCKIMDNAPAKPVLNMVQTAKWPDVQPPVSLASSTVVLDLTDQPGSWSALPAGAQLAQSLHPSMAHTMRVGRVLRPVYDGQLKKVRMATALMLLLFMHTAHAQQHLEQHP